MNELEEIAKQIDNSPSKGNCMDGKTDRIINYEKEENIIKILSDLKHRIFPRPFERLAVKGEDLIGVEIGVYKAEHAESLLRSLLIKKIFLIDPYDLYSQYNEGKRHYGIDQTPLDLAEKEAMERLKKYSDKIVWIKSMSSDCLNEIPEELDFVYIDGNHQRPFIDEDINYYYPKLKRGGILGGHDYYNGFCNEHDGVVQAVTEFVIKNNLQLFVELPDWWC